MIHKIVSKQRRQYVVLRHLDLAHTNNEHSRQGNQSQRHGWWEKPVTCWQRGESGTWPSSFCSHTDSERRGARLGNSVLLVLVSIQKFVLQDVSSVHIGLFFDCSLWVVSSAGLETKRRKSRNIL